MGSEAYHESIDRLSPETVELHRAIESLREELEAIDWYQQRVDATADPALQRVLRHNRNEEIEHASMVLEWIRRQDRDFDQALRNYLFQEGEITEIEKVVEETGQEPEP
ncbi:MAG TPA: encapsulin-associated ferritin-like protein [Coleofasciculaceae cyanobacterium]|jgi:hypothetical protein